MWITYFNEGKEHPDVFEFVEETLPMVSRRQVFLITSVITRAELLEARVGPANLRFYDDQFNRPNVIDQPVTRGICSLASDYRSHFKSLRKRGTFADALHLATAVENKVDELHTTDADDLLPCDGDLMVRGTRVVRPQPERRKLFTGVDRIPEHPRPERSGEGGSASDVAAPNAGAGADTDVASSESAARTEGDTIVTDAADASAATEASQTAEPPAPQSDEESS